MPTPSSDASTMPAAAPTVASVDSSDTMRFRAPTLEAAIALAETSLGARVRVVAANRIRRGGIGGFFASDLGVEVTVALDDETMEQALERLVADAPAGDDPFGLRGAHRPAGSSAPSAPLPAPLPAPLSAFTGVRDAQDAPAPPSIDVSRIGSRFDRRDDDDQPAVNPVLSEVLAALISEAADLHQERQSRPHPVSTPTPIPVPTLIIAPTVAEEPRHRPVYDTPPTMVRVDQIIAELSAITAEPVFGHDRGRGRVARPTSTTAVPVLRDDPDGSGAADTPDALDAFTASTASTAPRSMSAPRPKVLPTLPPRASDVARRASVAAAANHARALASPAMLETVGRAGAVASRGAGARGVSSSAWPAAGTIAGTTEITTPLVDVAVDRSASERLAESVRSMIDTGDGEHDPCVVTAHQRTASDGAVHASVEIDTGVLEPATADRDGEHGRGISSPRHGGSSNAPSRRQVELAVAATDQLIESLTRDDGVKRLSVRVVLRTADRREVEAEAEWESS